jgi:hypothetical protein
MKPLHSTFSNLMLSGKASSTVYWNRHAHMMKTITIVNKRFLYYFLILVVFTYIYCQNKSNVESKEQ